MAQRVFFSSPTYGMFWHALTPFKLKISLSFLTIALGAGAVLMGGQSLRQLALTFDQPIDSAKVFGLLMLVGGILSIVAFARTYTTTLLARQVITVLQDNIIQKSLKLHKQAFDSLSPGAISSVWQSDLQILENLLAQHFPLFLRSLLQLIGGLILCVYASPSLALATLGIMICLGVPLRFLLKSLRNWGKKVQECEHNRILYLTNIWAKLPFIQALSAAPQVMNTYQKRTQKLDFSFKKRAFLRSSFISFVILGVLGGLILLLFFGRQNILAGHSHWSDLLVFAYYALIISSSCHTLAEQGSLLSQSQNALTTLYDFLTLDEENTKGKEIPNSLDIHIENLFFSYENSVKNTDASHVFKDLTLSIQRGTSLGLVGPSGSGKTTLLYLLMGFYSPQKGSLSIGTSSFSSIDLNWWRQQIFWISQDPVVLPGTLRDHLCLGLGLYTDSVLIKTMETVGLALLLKKLPNGLETWVGEGGYLFSGGEKQRLALTRALLANRPILLFDEPTSALDARSEHLMGQEMISLLKEKTCIMVAHRLSSLQSVQKIIVLDQGKIIEEGSHHDLMKKNGLYKTFVDHQTTFSTQVAPHVLSL